MLSYKNVNHKEKNPILCWCKSPLFDAVSSFYGIMFHIMQHDCTITCIYLQHRYIATVYWEYLEIFNIISLRQTQNYNINRKEISMHSVKILLELTGNRTTYKIQSNLKKNISLSPMRRHKRMSVCCMGRGK